MIVNLLDGKALREKTLRNSLAKFELGSISSVLALLLLLATNETCSASTAPLPPTIPQITNPTVINMRTAGAKGDGVTDDSSAIRQAINNAPNNSKFYFPAGTYRLHDLDISNRSRLLFEGDGASTILKVIPNPQSFAFIVTFTNVSDLIIQNISFDNTNVISYGGVRFYSVQRVLVQNTWFTDSQRRPPTSIDRYSYVFAHGATSSQDVTIRNNVIDNLQLEVDYCQRAEVTDNRLTLGTQTAGIGLFTIENSTLMEDYRIERNTIVNPENIASGIAVHLDPNSTSNCTFRRIWIANNTITRNTTRGVGISVGCTDVNIRTSGNIFEDITIQGNRLVDDALAPNPAESMRILSNGDYSFNRLTVENNDVTSNGRTSADNAITIRYATNSSVTGNLLKDVVHGFGFTGFANCKISGNNVKGSGIAYSVENSRGGNVFTGNFYYGSPSQIVRYSNAPIAGDTFATPTFSNPSVISPPAITSATSKSGTVGSALSYQITATNAPTAFSASGLPAGLSINTGTGLISGTPTTAGSTNVIIGASNSAGTGTATLALSVSGVSAGSSNLGFESPNVGAAGIWSSFSYSPSNPSWTIAGSAGISANGSGFTSGNPNAPEGAQVGLLQFNGSLSQAIAFPSGSSAIVFSAAQRGNQNHGGQDFKVLVDGTTVGIFKPSGITYADFTTQALTLSAGLHAVQFVGLNSAGGDNTAFIDNVRIVAITAVASGLQQGGFENPNVGPAGVWTSFLYAPSGSAWTFSSSAGLSANGSGFSNGNPGAPEGAQVAFLQGNGSVSQTTTLSAGTYAITLRSAQRVNMSGNNQTLRVSVDNQAVGDFRPAGSAYQLDTTAAFTVAAGAHTITCAGLNSNGDHTAFIDDVRIAVSGGPAVDPTLVSHWKLDEASGNTAADASGNNNTGTTSNGPAWTAGTIAGGLSFDGVNDSVSVSLRGLPSGNAAHSVAAWIMVSSLPANRAWIMLLGNEGSGAHHWLIQNNGVTQFGVWDGGQVRPVLPVGQWKHVATTFDGATLKGYVDGVLIGSTAATFNLQGLPMTWAQQHFGENCFNGVIDDVRVYKHALTAAEIVGLAAITMPASKG